MDAASPDRIADAALRSGCRSVAYTYNDPVIFLEYAVDVAAACRARGIKNVAVTAGYVKSGAREEFFQAMDAVNLDLKGFTEEFYHSLCTAHLSDVLETAKFIKHETNAWLELTTLIIPGHNDGDEELRALSSWVVENLGPDVPLHFSAFHPDFRMRDIPRTPPETLFRAHRIGKEIGLNYVYTGNIHHEETGSTYCPGCGEKLIGRDWYQITQWGVGDKGMGQGGHCTECGTAVAGIFEGKAGNWGRKRRPVRLASSAAGRVKLPEGRSGGA